MQPTNIDIFDTVFTKEEIFRYISRLEELRNELYKVGANIEEKLDTLFTSDERAKILNLFQTYRMDMHNKDHFDQILTFVDGYAKSLPVLTISVAFAPTEQTLKGINNWITMHLKRKVVLDMQQKKDIIGGAVLIFNGLYKDYSLQKRLGEMMKNVKVGSE